MVCVIGITEHGNSLERSVRQGIWVFFLFPNLC
jgi:hypothetical protein